MNEIEEKIKRLSIDKCFGILTRNALDEEIATLDKPFSFLFIDINNLRKLNNLIGYDNVNVIIKRIFSTFQYRNECIIGKYFSGDEVILIHKNPEMINNSLQLHFHKNDMSFKSKIYKGRNDIEKCRIIVD